MLRGQHIRSADKLVSDWGKWQTGAMGASAFPLSKRRNRSYRVGSAFKWRVVIFSCLGEHCRLLIAFNPQKEQYIATLGVERERDMTIIASLEFHGTHPGWHLHGACGNVDNLPAGSMRGSAQKRLPSAGAVHRRCDFTATTEGRALDIAADFFRLHKTEGAMI